ncbi:hypothetical protein RVR_P183 (plasmid) [Actinacidiphila reveromycinica]|uniref:GGDEF domain-containing protein n=1 Tax=Actinacidiphila reveromycinica TaxID=659352 RepID=A0A7R6QDW3_9ACTN|nr:GGDEF domain-containing protein [Streptomyces sp. SN-593]BBG20701.1 hypothetical protein RVR_P183 [Streptomyces sp. SN-593]
MTYLQLALQMGGLPLAATIGWAAHAHRFRRDLDAARRDPLTGLHTRAGWTAQAERIISDPAAAVLLIDLDRFKRINDRYGHAAGDTILTAAASRLTAWCRPGEIAGRLGGDEFVAAVTGPGLDARLADLQAALHQTVAIDGRQIQLAASIGVSRVADLPEPTVSSALAAADTDMYRIKGRGRRGHRLLSAVHLAA